MTAQLPEQLQLVEIPRPLSASRPVLREQAVLDRAMPAVNGLFSKYLSSEQVGEITEIREFLETEHDGYEMARRLEREHYWEPDRELMNVCDDAISEVENAYRQLVEEWIAAFNIQPKLALEQGVKVSTNRAAHGTELHDGIITGIHPKSGKYTVMIPTCGHVRKGVGTHGVLLNWEDVEGQQL